MQMFVQAGVISHRFLQEGRLNVFLENVRQTVEHRHYYFGHMHLDNLLASFFLLIDADSKSHSAFKQSCGDGCFDSFF